MKRTFFFATLLLVAIPAYVFIRQEGIDGPEKNIDPIIPDTEKSIQDDSTNSFPRDSAKEISPFRPPIQKAEERVTKKPFGILIAKETSPVQPERFAGYHTGTDFEIFPKELNIPVSITAICDGTLQSRTRTNGYGGVAVQSCIHDDRPITIIYGHLKLESITIRPGDSIRQGDLIGNLGDDKSSETDGERKHLHLGIHRGSTANLRGYVSRQSELAGWIDPLSLFSSER